MEDQELLEDLVLFQVKYYESKSLTDQFLGEYEEVLSVCQARFPQLFQAVATSLAAGQLSGITEVSNHAVSNLVLLIQTAKARVNAEVRQAFLVFQGEPAWKQFLLQELQDLGGKRVSLQEVSPGELPEDLGSQHLILSNLPLDSETKATVIYLSMVPTERELGAFRTWLQNWYL